MSAGFKVDGEVFWGTNGAVEAYVEAMGAIALELFGADDPMTAFFRDELEGIFPGRVVVLNECLDTRGKRTRLLRVLDDATHRILSSDTFTEHGRDWVATVVAELRSKLVQLDAERSGAP